MAYQGAHRKFRRARLFVSMYAKRGLHAMLNRRQENKKKEGYCPPICYMIKF
jgi:hypothetical protein